MPRWTFWEILGLLVSAVLVAGPLISLGYTWLFPTAAPAQILVDTPTVVGTPTATYTPGGPTLTPTHTPGYTSTPSHTPAPSNTPMPSVTPQPTTPGGGLTVSKVANVETALPGEEVVFTIGFDNQTTGDVVVSVEDTLPDQLSLANVWHSCPAGSISYPPSMSFRADLTVPAGGSCQVFVVATVDQGCGCYVQNEARWASSVSSGVARSQPPVFLPQATPGPPTQTTPPATPTSTDTPAPGATQTPTYTPPPGATQTPTYTPPPGATQTPTYTPPPGATRTPTYTPPPGATQTPTYTPPPGATQTPTFTPSPGPSLTPTPTPQPTTPGEQPTRRPREPEPTLPTETPSPVCAQARIVGKVCAAGVQVTISSCCPEWSASTMTDAQGNFEFAALTPGTFAVRAQGRSRTVTLPACDSVATVNLCPVPAAPTSPAAPTATSTPTATVPSTVTVVPTAGPPGTQAPSTGEVTLLLEVDRTEVQAGEGLVFLMTLHNGQATEIREEVVVGCVFTDALELQGAAAPRGDVKLFGQNALLTARGLAASGDLTFRVDAAVRFEVQPWTAFTVQATGRPGMGEVVYSNVVEVVVVGQGAPPLTREETPGTVVPVGGAGEMPVTPVPAQVPGGLGTQIPYTGTGLPMAGVMLGGVVLVVRHLRLRRAGRGQEEE